MIRILMLASFIFCNIQSRAQYPGYTLVSNPESFKVSFSRATAPTISIQADFSQEKTLSMLSEKISSSGKFWFQKNNKMRMEYIRPYPYLIILNAGKIFIKDGQKENKVSAGSNKVFQQVNRILMDCVDGNMLNNADFQSRIFESGGSYLIELKPRVKNLKELYKNINIVIDKKDYSAGSIGIYEISGDQTMIRFQNKSINAPIPDSVFIIP
jgi:outer membrane lipoprotein-sorting protein